MGKLVDVHKFFCSECEYDSESECTWGGTCFARDFHTDYDVDKVVEQLEEFREEAKQFGADGMLTDIIDIVKRGGVDAKQVQGL